MRRRGRRRRAGLLAPLIPRVFTSDGAVISRATGAFVVMGVMLVPAGIAYALDGVLIGAADYGFLGLAAFAYLAVLVPLGALVHGLDLGIVAIWVVLLTWMLLRSDGQRPTGPIGGRYLSDRNPRLNARAGERGVGRHAFGAAHPSSRRRRRASRTAATAPGAAPARRRRRPASGFAR